MSRYRPRVNVASRVRHIPSLLRKESLVRCLSTFIGSHFLSPSLRWIGPMAFATLIAAAFSFLLRLPMLMSAPSASKAFLRLLEDVDADGVWHPKNLRSQPKPGTAITYHCWPLTPDDGELASRQADITFRLARIAKRLGWRLEYS